MAWCKNCNKEVEPVGKRHNMCPECKLFVPRDKNIEVEEKEKIEEKEKAEEKVPTAVAKKRHEQPYQISAPKTVTLGGREMALAEILINAGLARDFNDLTKKGLYVMSAMFNMPGYAKMEDLNLEKKKEEPDPRRLSKELLEQQMLSAYIKNLERGGSNQDPLQMMMLMRMLENREQGKPNQENNFMDKLLQLQMIKSLTQQNPENQLSREISDLKYQMQMQQLLSQGSKTPLQDQLMALEKLRGERDREIKEMDIKLQTERDKNLKELTDNRLKDLEKQIQHAQSSGGLTSQRLTEFKEELKAIKEMSAELGEREKSAGEYISEALTNAASTLQPTITELIKQKQANPQPFPQLPPEQIYEPLPEQFQPIPKSELSPSEREISDTMSNMYIRKK